MLTGVLMWILFGLVVGAIAKFVMPGRDPGGLGVTIALGIAGALVAGLLGQLVGFYTAGDAAGLITSVLGAVICCSPTACCARRRPGRPRVAERRRAMSGPLLFVVAAISLMPAAQQERQMGGAGILTFTDPGYRGQNATFRQDVADLSSYRFNDRISSFRVAPGEMWRLRVVLLPWPMPGVLRRGTRPPVPGVERQDFVDGVCPGPVGPSSRRASCQAALGRLGHRVVLGSELPGRSPDVDGGVGRSRSLNFDNRAASLRIHGSQPWEVCADSVFRNCLVVNSDWGDLRRLGPYRRISSVRPWNSGGDYEGPTTLPGVVEQLRLYEHVGYGGRNLPINKTCQRYRVSLARSAHASPAVCGSCATARTSVAAALSSIAMFRTCAHGVCAVECGRRGPRSKGGWHPGLAKRRARPGGLTSPISQ